MKEIPDLTTALAALYAKKSHRTLLRDVDYLEQEKWVEVSGDGVRARTEILRSFVPDVRLHGGSVVQHGGPSAPGSSILVSSS